MPPPPKNPYEQWCPFDNLEKDDIFPILDYKGSCPKCGTGTYPAKIMACFQRTDGQWHVFIPLGIVRCEGCRSTLKFISVLCQSIVIDVTSEFKGLKK
jgi:hypothetical protein